MEILGDIRHQCQNSLYYCGQSNSTSDEIVFTDTRKDPTESAKCCLGLWHWVNWDNLPAWLDITAVCVEFCTSCDLHKMSDVLGIKNLTYKAVPVFAKHCVVKVDELK